MARKKGSKENDDYGDSLKSLFALAEKGKIEEEKRDFLTVSEFLDDINESLRIQKNFVAGEVTDFKAHEKWVSFSLKDKEDNSILRCFLSVWTYRKAGVLIEDGMEIKVGGYSRIYKLAGTFSFNVETIEPLGEGSLKKAYLLLLKKLELEGLFGRKRPLPGFIKNIGVISSKDGVVIHDFCKNLKSFGYKIKFFNSRVEGAEAVSGIISGLKYFNNKNVDLDVIVIMRGGGSLESMQAFNNEQVCREIFASKIPVLCGIGHEVDVPISCLVADLYVSTPTATAYTINESWGELISGLPLYERRILSDFSHILRDKIMSLPNIERNILSQFNFVLLNTKRNAGFLSGKIFSGFKQVFLKFNLLSDKVTKNSIRTIEGAILKINTSIQKFEKILIIADPERNLRLGYSIVFNKRGKVIKNVDDLSVGETLTTKLGRGELETEVKLIK